MKQLNDTIKALVNNQGSLSSTEKIPEFHNPAGHFQPPPGSYTGYNRPWVPNYGCQELHPYLPPPPPPAYWPLPLTDRQPTAASLAQSIYDQQSVVSPMQRSCTDQQSPVDSLTQTSAASISPTQSNYNSGQQSSSDSSTHTSSLSFDDSDNEYVPPLPPPLPISLDDKHNETDAGEKEEVRLPLKPCQSHQISFEGPNKKQKKKGKDKRIYPITEVFNNVFLSDCLAESVSRPNFSLNLVTKFFKEEVRLTSNVSGRRKNQLDTDMISAIKVASFRMWPLKSNENKDTAWRDCVKAIDEGGRRLRRRKVATLTESEGTSKENQ